MKTKTIDYRGLTNLSWRSIQLEDPPCEKFRCDNIERCKNEKLACDSFMLYVAKGRGINPSVPNRANYIKLFSGEDDE